MTYMTAQYKKKSSENVAIHKLPKTTIRLEKLNIIKLHAMENNESLNNYISRIIKEDILHHGSEYIIKKYFKEQPEVNHEKNKTI